ncbi:hypothetical protein E4U43_008274 [Claviceps pusilla]|uniref:Deacetylase sirtuin-type domain-containing protein n=1 Tax=Claviceps pusilla TaxID=123648 RepID=A0A9P7NBD4_9HYPO|nr:hypothetical protein E4U43_008274 [Claviceps pusilla]
MGQQESTLVDESVPPVTLTERTLSALAEYIRNRGAEAKVVVCTGAGISTAAGRLYSNLARLNLPHAEAVFDISYFRGNPEPFYVLAQELHPGRFHPTVTHVFISLLAQKGLLLKLFTQNIDCLERKAGVPVDKIVEAHGSFATQRCIDCQAEFPDDEMREHVLGGKVPLCKEPNCTGIVKPDIVFFGERMPSAFHDNWSCVGTADVVLVLGTSLSVEPFASLPEAARTGTPRLLINKERVGGLGCRTDDVLALGSCDDGVRRLADELGWRDELETRWRGLVGDEEAERQLRSAAEQEEALEDEVNKLAEGVESILKLQESSSQVGGTMEDGDVEKLPTGATGAASPKPCSCPSASAPAGADASPGTRADADADVDADAHAVADVDAGAGAGAGAGADERDQDSETSAATTPADKVDDSRNPSANHAARETHQAPQDNVLQPAKPRAPEPDTTET